MSEWVERKLGEVCSRLSSGSNITAKDIHESGSIPVYGGNGIRGYAAEANFSGECAIIGRQGAYCGNVRYFKGTARMSEHAVVACAGPSHNTRFLAYLLSDMNLGSLSGQAAQPGLSVKVLAQQSVQMPSRQMQERIADILGAYDDLIEVNQQRIAVLEEMARGLFEEWFVRFRFPGHETVPILDTPNGPLPEGWIVQSLGKLGNVITGKTPSKSVSDYFVGDVPFVKIPDLHSSIFIHTTKETLSEYGASSQANKMVPAGSLCVSCIGTIGLVAITAVPCQTNQQINTLIPLKIEWTEYLYFSLIRAKSYLENLGSNGATMGNVNKQKFSSILITCPPPELLSMFHDRAAPLLKLIKNLEQANRALAKSRDLLLPRLISGQLCVAEAEHQLEGIA